MREGYTEVTVDNNSIFTLTVLNRKILPLLKGQKFQVPRPADFKRDIDILGHNITVSYDGGDNSGDGGTDGGGSSPTLTISSIGDGGFVDTDHSTHLIISGATDVEDDQSVSLVIKDESNSEIHSESILVMNSAWLSSSIDLSAQEDGPFTAIANVTNAVGDAAPEATQSFTLQTGPTVKSGSNPVSELGLSSSLEGKLIAGGITTIEQLITMTAEELNAVDGIGEASVNTIEQALTERGLSLKNGEGA